jgi:hypothetical protein
VDLEEPSGCIRVQLRTGPEGQVLNDFDSDEPGAVPLRTFFLQVCPCLPLRHYGSGAE